MNNNEGDNGKIEENRVYNLASSISENGSKLNQKELGRPNILGNVVKTLLGIGLATALLTPNSYADVEKYTEKSDHTYITRIEDLPGGTKTLNPVSYVRSFRILAKDLQEETVEQQTKMNEIMDSLNVKFADQVDIINQNIKVINNVDASEEEKDRAYREIISAKSRQSVMYNRDASPIVNNYYEFLKSSDGDNPSIDEIYNEFNKTCKSISEESHKLEQMVIIKDSPEEFSKYFFDEDIDMQMDENGKIQGDTANVDYEAHIITPEISDNSDEYDSGAYIGISEVREITKVVEKHRLFGIIEKIKEFLSWKNKDEKNIQDDIEEKTQYQNDDSLSNENNLKTASHEER